MDVLDTNKTGVGIDPYRGFKFQFYCFKVLLSHRIATCGLAGFPPQLVAYNSEIAPLTM